MNLGTHLTEINGALVRQREDAPVRRSIELPGVLTCDDLAEIKKSVPRASWFSLAYGVVSFVFRGTERDLAAVKKMIARLKRGRE